MSRMHNPAHPGEVLREWLAETMTVTQAAKELQVSRVTLSKVLDGKAGVTAGMAPRPTFGWECKRNGICGRLNNYPNRTSSQCSDWRLKFAF